MKGRSVAAKCRKAHACFASAAAPAKVFASHFSHTNVNLKSFCPEIRTKLTVL